MIIQREHIVKKAVGIRVNDHDVYALVKVYELEGPIYILERPYGELKKLEQITSEEFEEMRKLGI